MPSAYRIALLAGALLLSGCSIFSSDSKPKPAELAEFSPSAELVEMWSGSAGKAGEFTFSPAIVQDSVYVAGQSGKVTRYDHGREVWRVDLDEKLSGGVGSDGKLVAVGTPKGEVLVLDAETGKQLWKAKVSSEVLAAPSVGDGLVVVRTGDSRIAGLDAADGKRRWLFQRTMPVLTVRSPVGVLLGQQVVVAGLPGGKLVALNNQTGATIWEVPVAQPKGATELERIADVTSTPVVRDRDICAAAFQGRVACFDIATGSLKWSRDVSSSAGIDMDDKHVYVSDDKGTIHAYSRDTGASVWKQDKLFMRALTRPLALDRRVAVADFQGVVHLLDADTGAFVARYPTRGGAVRAELQKYEDGLVVQTEDGEVVALRVR